MPGHAPLVAVQDLRAEPAAGGMCAALDLNRHGQGAELQLDLLVHLQHAQSEILQSAATLPAARRGTVSTATRRC